MSKWVRPEFQLLIASAAVDAPGPPSHGDLDWDEVLRLAMHHRLEGLLNSYLSRTGMEVPDEIAQRLHDRRRHFAVGQMAARVQVRQLWRTLESAGVRAVALKGAALMDGAYAQAGLRPLGDIDLLVSPEDLEAALRAVLAAGYQERQAARPARPGLEIPEHHHHPALRHPNHTYPIELHVRPTFTGRSDAAPVLASAQPSSAGDYLLPDPSDHLVILAAHFITDREVGSLVALGQLADIARVAGEARLDQIADRAFAWGLGWETFAALDAVRRLKLAPVPDGQLAALRPTFWIRGTTDALIRHRVLADSTVSMTPRRFSPGLRGSLIPGRTYLQARYGMSGASAAQLYAAHARSLTRSARPLILSALRHPRRSAGELILARRLRTRSSTTAGPHPGVRGQA